MFTVQPDVTSGNGNLAILVIVPFLPIFIASYFFTYKMAKDLSYNIKKQKIRVFLLSFSLLCSVLLAFLVVNYTSELITALGGSPSYPDSRIYRFGWFNQYTNSLFFNVYTFWLTHVLAVMIGIVSVIKVKS